MIAPQTKAGRAMLAHLTALRDYPGWPHSNDPAAAIAAIEAEAMNLSDDPCPRCREVEPLEPRIQGIPRRGFVE